MHFTGRSCVTAALLIASMSILPVQSSAEQDYLIGSLVRDLDAIAPGAVTMETAEGVQVCELRKARFRLLQAEKNGGDDLNGGPAGEFVCYNAKCTGPFADAVTVRDQFGVHDLDAKVTKIVCAPVDKAVCGDGEIDAGEQCDGADLGSCTSFCKPDCTCAPECRATTGGYCWLLGAPGQSCDTVCASALRTYAPETESYAGSGGSDANCQAILTEFGSTVSFESSPSCTDAVGCGLAGAFAGTQTRCASPTTTSAAFSDGYWRACACQ